MNARAFNRNLRGECDPFAEEGGYRNETIKDVIVDGVCVAFRWIKNFPVRSYRTFMKSIGKPCCIYCNKVAIQPPSIHAPYGVCGSKKCYSEAMYWDAYESPGSDEVYD